MIADIKASLVLVVQIQCHFIVITVFVNSYKLFCMFRILHKA
jgi:hypothetical protein